MEVILSWFTSMGWRMGFMKIFVIFKKNISLILNVTWTIVNRTIKNLFGKSQIMDM